MVSASIPTGSDAVEAARQNPVYNTLITNVLQDFRQLCPWFRSQPVLERRGMQMCPVGASCRGIHQTRDNTAHASEPRRNPKNPLQFIEKLSVARLQQASPPVQMQRKRGASEPRIKAESGSQAAHNKRVARLSATVPEVQIPAWFGMSQNANAHWRYFWQAEWSKHLNLKITQINRCNLLRDFPLQGFNKHPHRFRCSGKGEHLNLASRQNPAVNPFTTSALQDFWQLCPRFRCRQKLLSCRRRYLNFS